MLTPLTISQISDASTLRITLLLFVKLQYTRFLLISNSSVLVKITFTKTIKYLIQELKSLLFANNLLTKTNSLRYSRSTDTYLIPLSRLFIYYSSYLFIIQILVSVESQYQAATDKSYKASSQQINTIYAPQARCSIYYYFQSSVFKLTGLSFLPQSFCRRSIVLSIVQLKIYLLNTRLFIQDNSSRSFVVRQAFCSSSSSRFVKQLDLRNNVLLVCILTTLNISFRVVISRHRLYKDVIINSFSL